MNEELREIIKEKISADHLLYVSMKYTKTCDVMINLIKRWKIMLDDSVNALLLKAKKKKIIKTIPSAPRPKIDVIMEIFKDKPEITTVMKDYEMFRLIDTLKKTRESEFRKGVCLRITYQGKEIAVNMDKLKEYSENLEKFINYTKLFLTS